MIEIWYNPWLPLPRCVSMMFFGKAATRNVYKPKKGLTEEPGFWDPIEKGKGLPGHVVNHEGIHKDQAMDFKKDGDKTDRPAYFRFYWAYFKQWLRYGYKNCPFEREANIYAMWPEYRQNRERRAWEMYDTKNKRNGKTQ